MKSLVKTDRRLSRRILAPARGLFTLSWALLAASGARAQSPSLAKDIYPGVAATTSASAGFGQIAGVSGGRAFVWGFPDSSEDGLWVTDGSPAGTRQILGGPLKGAGAGTDLDGTFYFGASSSEGASLWRSDGTAAGTLLVKQVPASFGDYSSLVLTNVGGRLFFTVDDDIRGTELWASDGTPTGTALVKRLTVQPGPCSYAARPVGVGSTLFFSCESASGETLWKSDGSEAGTVPIAEFVAVSSLVSWNGTLFLSASDAEHGSELWKSDGTPGGTVLVKDLVPGASSSNPTVIVTFGGALYFRLRTDTDGSIWKSDGTDGGTVPVHPLPSGGGLVPCGDRLFFSTGGTQLWATDGSIGGATLIRDFQATISIPDSTTVVPGTLLFWVGIYGNATVTELWKSDGTPGGTSLVKVVPARADRGGLEWPSYFGSTSLPGAFLTVFDSGSCLLWGSDGTPAGTLPLVASAPEPNNGFPSDLTDVNGTLFFSAADAEHGRELWRSDGTSVGTVLVTDLEPGPVGSGPTQLFATQSGLFFRAGTQATGNRLYRTDGTGAGTILLEDDCPQILGLVGEVLVFVGNDGVHGREPFRSDGTPGGTFPLGDLTPGLASTTVAALGALNGSFYFLTLPSDPAGTTLWKTDGTVAGTVAVRPMAGHHTWYPARAAAVGNVLVFTCEDEAYDRELWRTDGTAAGTSILLDNAPAGDAARNDIGESLVPLGSRIVFWADDGVHGFEPWVTDGTSSGTSLLKDVNPGPAGSSNPAHTASTGSTLYFGATDGVHGPELWKTDGTAPGTALVRDIVPGPIGSIHTGTIAAAGHEVFFVADDQASGRELWRTNGTAAGTARVADLLPGPGSSVRAGDDLGSRSPLLASSAGRFYFTATDGTTGYELWSFPVPTGFHTFVPCPSRRRP